MGKLESTNGWVWIGIFLYIVQMIAFPYLIYIYVYKNITGEMPAACSSPSPGTDADDDNSTKFFVNQINKCDIKLTTSVKKGLRRLGLFFLALKIIIDLVILYFILPFEREELSGYAQRKASSAGERVASGAKSASKKVAAGAREAGRVVSDRMQKAVQRKAM